MKLDSYFTPLMKINLKWIKDLHARPETVKLLEENTREKLLDWSWQSFFGYDTKAEAIKPKADKWDYIKIIRLYTAEGNNQQSEEEIYGRKYFQTMYLIGGYKELTTK